MRRARSIWLVSLLGLSLAGTLSAQDVGTRSESTKGAVLKNRAPVSNEVLKVTFPKPKEVTLKNGLTVMVLEDHRLPTVYIQVQVRHGALSDPADRPGLASFTADLLKEGTGKQSSLEIAQNLDRMGASFSASASFGTDVTDLGIAGLSEYTDGLVTQLADLVLRPSWPATEVDKYRERELASLSQLRAQPGFLAGERFLGALYPNSPVSVTAPTEASLKGFTREDLIQFHDRYYLPNDAILAVTGDVTMASIVPKLEKAFGAWKKGKAEPMKLPGIKPSEALKISLVNRPGSVQTSLRLGNVGITRTDPDFYAVSVMNHILGGGIGSRLFLDLREKRGFTYGVRSMFKLDTYPGPFTAAADVRTDVTQPALAGFIENLDKMRNEPVTDKELADAKRALVAKFALSLESSESLTGRAVELKRFGLPADYWDKYPAMIDKVTAQDVQRVAQKYLDPKTMQVVAVGDADKIRESLKQLGPVVEFTADGVGVAR